jgi:hypothetical protein
VGKLIKWTTNCRSKFYVGDPKYNCMFIDDITHGQLCPGPERPNVGVMLLKI